MMQGPAQLGPIRRSAATASAIVVVLACGFLGGPVRAEERPGKPAAGDDLSIEQARLADRFQRLETVLTRLSELSASTDPRRARLLREAVAKSREQDLSERFETIVSLLEEERLSAAASHQTDLEHELDDLLTLLQKADRDRELQSQHERIKKYLQEVGRLIRLQKGLNARTEGGDAADRLVKDQGQVADQTGELGNAIGETEHRDADQDAQSKNPAKPPDDHPSDGSPQKGKSEKGTPSKGTPSPGEPGPSGDKPSGGQPSESGGSPPSDSAPPEGQPPPGGESGGEPGQSQPSPPQDPADRAAERLKTAQERMKEAQQQLEQAERDGASAEQREAVKELEQAKAELERVLRQVREEEMERTLTMLAARFRKMLQAQLKVYEGTVHVDHVPEADRGHDQEIDAARLSREESSIMREADRALVLLREEGSSVAFPETVSLMREDMQKVTERLAEVKVGTLTQGLEQDIIEALEESIASLEKAIKDLEKKRTPPGQSPQAGQPTEPPLVDKLAELRMIRSLQARINRRTERYGRMIEGEQAETPEVLQALTELAERQQRVYQATNDLSQGRND